MCPMFVLVEEVARDTTLKMLLTFEVCPKLLFGTPCVSSETSQ